MPISIVQRKSADVASTTSTTLSFPSATTAGNKIIVALRIGGTSTAAITDGSNTYSTDVSLLHSGLGTLYIISVDNAASVTTLTCTLSGGAATIRWVIYEYSGLATSSSLDKTAILYTGTGASSVNSGNTATTTQASELLLGACAGNAPETVTAGTTQSYTLEDAVPAAPNTRLTTEDVTVSATGAYQADFGVTTSTDHIVAIATYKAAAGGGVTIVIDAPEQQLAGFTSTTQPYDAIDPANYEWQDPGILPRAPVSQQFEEGETSRSFDWRYSQHGEDASSRAPNAPVSEQFEEGEMSRSFDWRVVVDDGQESSKTPPAPVFAQEEPDTSRSFDWRYGQHEEDYSARVPTPPPTISPDHDFDHSYWRDFRVVFDDGTESSKQPPVVAVTPTAADEAFEARSYDWRAIFDDSTESSSGPPTPISLQEDGDFHRSTDYRVTVDDGTEASSVPAAPFSQEELGDVVRSFDRVFGYQEEDYSQKTPPVIITPTTAIDDFEAFFAPLQTSAIVTDLDWTSTAPPPPKASQDDELVQPWGSLQTFWIEDEASDKTPPPPPIILTAADDDFSFIDWTGYARFAAEIDSMLLSASLGPFVLIAALHHTTYSRLVANGGMTTYSQLVAAGGMTAYPAFEASGGMRTVDPT